MQEGKSSQTAEIVTLIRALEFSWRGERSLLQDRYAKNFLDTRFKAIYHTFAASQLERLFNLLSFGIYDWIVLRHAFIDSLVRKHGTKMPVLLLGAGYDSRSFRLAPYITGGIYEVDFAATQDRKLKVFNDMGVMDELLGDGNGKKPVHFVQADFRKEQLSDILVKTGIDGPALVIWEGVSMYVEEEVVAQTIKSVGEVFGPGTVMVADFYVEPDSNIFQKFTQRIAKRYFDVMFSEPLLFSAPPEHMQTLALAGGAKQCEIYDPKELEQVLELSGLSANDYNQMAVFSY